MADVVRLVEGLPPAPGVVEALEKALEMAKSGEIRSIVIFGQLTEERTFYASDLSEGSTHLAISACERFKYSLLG